MDKKFLIQVAGLVILILIGALITKNNQILNFLPGNIPVNELNNLKIGQTKIRAELADTEEKRIKGLGGRDNLATDSGMLFIFNDTAIHRFWMKDMKIPLDFIWIKDDKVVDLLNNVQPPKPNTADSELTVYQPSEPVNKVLEVNAGFINFFGIRIGDTIELKAR